MVEFTETSSGQWAEHTASSVERSARTGIVLQFSQEAAAAATRTLNLRREGRRRRRRRRRQQYQHCSAAARAVVGWRDALTSQAIRAVMTD